MARKRRMKSKDKIQENNMAIRNGLLKKLCGLPELLTFKTVKWRYRDKREDDIGTHSQKWQSTKTDQTIPSVQALQYNSITVSINHIFALGSENITRITWMTRIFICKFPPFLISHRYFGAAKTEWKLGFTLLSRVRISQRQITEIYYPRTHGEHGKD